MPDAGRVRTALRLQDRRGPRLPHGLCGFRRGGVRCRGRRRTPGLSGLLARGCEARGGPRGDAGRRRDDVRRARLSRRPPPPRRAPPTRWMPTASPPASPLPWISRGGRIDLPTKSRRCAWPTDCPGLADGAPGAHGRGDRALYSYTCGRCGARVTVSVCIVARPAAPRSPQDMALR